ncbi:hypothetical protein GQX73_g3288 [Xylaria multiplex]|uniref:Uncharacterized protein n=1 Tax=Xylaria multiplex TaxID=323545 RepID=A0A7C8IR95_9PEZI|nr:hypothetical protein GQX73_g3288 [Xylaria multiplex]
MTIDISKDSTNFQVEASPVFPAQKQLNRYIQEPIAIIGMGCRLPGHNNCPHELWTFLQRGGIADNEPPPSRFRGDTHYDGSRKPKTMRSPGGMFLEDVDPKKFDAAFFGVGTVDAIAMDPQQRQLLEVVYECLENAGIQLEKLNGEAVGCFVGSYAVDYADMQARDPDDRAPSVTVGVGRAILSNRISHFLNVHGPSMTIDTACSGSLVGLDVACRYLTTGEINGALVAGANLYLSPEHNMDTGSMKGASSTSGRCHTFDKKADGYIKAEAVNCIFLKRLADAERDGDPIRGIIRGTATNSDGRTPGIASPSAEAQAMATRAAYANAGITDLSATGYIEMHGTGTQAGDPEEVKGVAAVFAASRSEHSPLIIGSIKSNIGHSEPAAGISGLIKAVLVVENNCIPGNPTFIDPNPNINFEMARVRVTCHTIPWPAQTGPRRASVNSFGYGGSNAHVIIDQVPKEKQNFVSSFGDELEDILSDKVEATRPQILVFSANDESSLISYTESLRKHLINPRVTVGLDCLAYTLSERRTRHFHRGYIVTKNRVFNPTEVVYGKRRSEPPRLGFIFTGQGAQWSQMGRSLLQNFPVAADTITRLDEILKSFIHPPSWTLAGELTESRDPDELSKPEFSQPLVTALQIAIVNTLRTWGVRAEAVLGHSSGEIAAAYTAGLLSEENAMKVAYYRGFSSNATETRGDSALGMMAVGLGGEDVKGYIAKVLALYPESKVPIIACFNSPSSVTLSGTLGTLEAIRSLLVADGYFARVLRVKMAYHSPYMAAAGDEYVRTLEAEAFSSLRAKSSGVKMFSSVYGECTEGPLDVAYWKSNMMKPVLFEQAIKQMLSQAGSPDFLIEIGPSAALAGPISQVLNCLSGAPTNIQYCAAIARGRNSENSMFHVAGRLFVAGHKIDLAVVNAMQGHEPPKVVVDLPNYSWNHATDYWYENEASQDWRYRRFPHHDLLGSKILGSVWHAPSWKKTLRVEDLPWLKDHRLGPEIVFPGAGYMCMATEAMIQTDAMRRAESGHDLAHKQQIRLRDVTLERALILQEGNDTRIMLTLVPFATQKDAWYYWVVRSLSNGSWIDHCKGQVRMEKDVKIKATTMEMNPFQIQGAPWYKSMSDVGYNFGKSFQKLQSVEATAGSRRSRTLIDLLPPPSEYVQSTYPLHPISFDGCMQSCAPALWAGIRTNVNAVLVPATIDDIVVRMGFQMCKSGVSVSEAIFTGLGRKELTENYSSNAKVYDAESGELIFKLTGLRYSVLDFDTPYSTHRYSRLDWQPDIILSPEVFQLSNASGWQEVQEIADLVAHKKPNLKVVEIIQLPDDSSSVWIEGLSSESKARNAFGSYVLLTQHATTHVAAQMKYETVPHTGFRLIDLRKAMHMEPEESTQDVDFIILRIPSKSRENIDMIMDNVSKMLHRNGHLLILWQSDRAGTVTNGTTMHGFAQDIKQTPYASKLRVVHKLKCVGPSSLQHGYLTVHIQDSIAISKPPLDIIHFGNPGQVCQIIACGLKSQGWDVQNIVDTDSLNNIRNDANILVVSELEGPLLPSLSIEQWNRLQMLLQMRNPIMWVSQGAQWKVKNPDGAMIYGLCRNVRTEDPSMNITILDVEDALSQSAVMSINKLLQAAQQPSPIERFESEFVERGGVFHVSRILGDDAINTTETSRASGNPAKNIHLHEASTRIHMIAERVGSIDSLHYVGESSSELPLPDNKLEVELFASGLNFKDVAVTMGIVPEDHHLLGLEGAGTIRRIGKNLNAPFHIGERVLVFQKGTFANRVVTTTERTIHIPDWLSFEEAATLPSVYLTSIHSLFNLSDIKSGHRVLIHSATGGLGLASIQICRSVGAEVYVTVGQDSKKQFLAETFGIPTDHILHSRNTEFESRIMELTEGHGVDIILNSLTGDLLDASWRCIAEGGTMVELGKKDLIDRSTLAMEPFLRNASYRCFDLSHKQVTDEAIAVLMKRMIDMITAGVVKPIWPIKLFPYSDIPSALRFMRSANHIGKIIISNKYQDSPDSIVPVRFVPKQLRLRGDVSYLIVGGLRGLCGSLALDMALQGARHLVVMARSGCDDSRSKEVLRDLEAQGCSTVLVRGDVSKGEDVRSAFQSAKKPVCGVIQGAMVLRDKPFEIMTHDEYHATIISKVTGTWNLHDTACDMGLNLDFFTMLSSVSGLIGQPAQANYAAANVFLDSFAAYRRGLGLKANSISLGAIDDVGYIAEHPELMGAFGTSMLTPINESLFQRIVQYSIMQQDDVPINSASSSHLITSIAVPQASSSRLLSDARFSALHFGASNARAATSYDAQSETNKEIQTLLLMVKGGTESAAVIASAVNIINKQFMLTLRLEEPLEPEKPLPGYGLDSLAAMEFRNWARAQLGVQVTTLEITSATTLRNLTEKIVTKMRLANVVK